MLAMLGLKSLHDSALLQQGIFDADEGSLLPKHSLEGAAVPLLAHFHRLAQVRWEVH